MGFEEYTPDKEFLKEQEIEDKKINRREALGLMAKGGAAIAGSVLGLKSLNSALKYIDKEEEKDLKEDNKSEKEESPEKKEARKIADEILRSYLSPDIYRRFNPQVFTKDFFMAQQYQESRYREDAESEAGAQGVYQDKPEATMEVVKFLNFLRKNNLCDYAGPDSIDLEKAKEIGNLFKEKGDYGRAVGKLYLLAIHDKESSYNNKPNPDVFRGKTAIEQQDLLLIAYHDGPSKRLHPEKASDNAKEYIHLIRKHMKSIGTIRDQLDRAGMSSDLDYAIIKIMREMERKENKGKPEETVVKWLKVLQEAHMKKWQETGNYEEPLTSQEIRNLFPIK